MVLLVTPTFFVPHLSIIAPWSTAQERGRLIFRTLAFRGGERNVVLSVKFDGEDREGTSHGENDGKRWAKGLSKDEASMKFLDDFGGFWWTYGELMGIEAWNTAKDVVETSGIPIWPANC